VANVHPARQIGVPGASQTAAGNQKRHRLQQICFAAAIRAIQHADLCHRTPSQRGIVAKIGQREAEETEHARKMAILHHGVKTGASGCLLRLAMFP
jgi:hypothetical protein